MDIREYIVSLKRDVDYDSFWAEMENSTNGLQFVPDRRVDILNERPGSLRQCHYALTDSEAKRLQEDPRVYSVEIPPHHRKDIEIVKSLSQVGNFTKTFSASGNVQNWGLKRIISEVNNFGEGTSAPGNYDYVLDGTDVDVVIMDSGIEAAHPEFVDKTGIPNLKTVDWYKEAGLATDIQLDLNVSSNSSVSSNSYINFQYYIQSFFAYVPTILGHSLVLGSNIDLPPGVPGVSTSTALTALYIGAEDSNRSYRIRFEGKVNPIDSENTLIWEVRFLDSNAIEVLVIRHDNPLGNQWFINSTETFQTLNIFFDSRLINGSRARSCVLTTNNDGENWIINGNESTDYRVDLVGGVWTVVEGLATERGTAGLTNEFTGDLDEGLFSFNTPFTFYTGKGSSGPQSPLHYGDAVGHGTHVAGIAYGNTFGWAKNCNRYSLKVAGLEGFLDAGSGISITDCFDLIKLWHQNKPINPNTGVKKPTVVNMSFGYRSSYPIDINGGSYRGTPWVDNVTKPEFGMIGIYHPVRVDSVDVDIQEMIDSGIHVVIAAGNYSHKIDIPTGSDYNNYYTSVSDPTPVYYNRGGSPYDDQALIVGNVDSDVYNALIDQKAESSETGPGVDIYAPGTNIISAMSVLNEYSSSTLYFPTIGTPLGDFFYQENLSGTSMAAPQVAGVCALILQIRPNLTPGELKNYLLSTATSVLYDNGLDDDYVNSRSLLGGTPRFLYHKFGVNKSFSLRFGG